MNKALHPSIENKSWVYRLPSQLACFLIASCLLTSQWNPCDATSVSGGSSLTFILLAMASGCLAAIDAVLSSSTNRPSSLQRNAVFSLVAFFAWLWICTALVPGKGNARFATNGCWQWIAQGVLAIAVASLCSRYRIGASILALMLGCAAGTVAQASFQYLVSMPALRKMFAENPNAIFERMDVVAGSAEAMQLANRLGSLEPTGPFALTNSLAGLMATWLVFVFVLLSGVAVSTFVQNKQSKLNLAMVTLFIGLAIAFLATLLLTKSRSAWLATAICLLLSFVVHPSLQNGGWALASRFRALILIAGLLIATAVGGILIRDPSIVFESGKSLSYRLDYWQGAWKLIAEDPWTGYGVSNFQQHYNRVKLATASESPADPHNFVLETALAGGVPLLALLMIVLTMCTQKTLQTCKASSLPSTPFGDQVSRIEDRSLAILLGSVCSIAGLAIFEMMFGDLDSVLSMFYFAALTLVIGLMVHRCDWLNENANTQIASSFAVAAMLAHLLASGGWMQPGLMNSVCVLGGLVFGVRQQPEPQSSTVTSTDLRFSIAYLLLVLASTAAFTKSMCMPVLAASGAKNALQGNPNTLGDPSDWTALTQVDRLDPELPSLVAKKLIETLSQSRFSETAKQKYCDLFDDCCKEYLRRDTNNWVSCAECSRWNAILANMDQIPPDKASGSSRIELAFEYAAKSAKLFPNSAQTQLQAAVLAAWAGKQEAARQYADHAEEIDQKTPHTDRKLAAIVVYVPGKMEKSFGELRGISPMGQAGIFQGEPILRWLRNTIR